MKRILSLLAVLLILLLHCLMFTACSPACYEYQSYRELKGGVIRRIEGITVVEVEYKNRIHTFREYASQLENVEEGDTIQ